MHLKTKNPGKTGFSGLGVWCGNRTHKAPLKPNSCAERRRCHRGNAPKNAPRWLPLAHLPSFRTMAQAPPNAPPTCRLSPSLYPRRSSGGGRETQQRASPHPTDTTPHRDCAGSSWGVPLTGDSARDRRPVANIPPGGCAGSRMASHGNGRWLSRASRFPETSPRRQEPYTARVLGNLGCLGRNQEGRHVDT